MEAKVTLAPEVAAGGAVAAEEVLPADTSASRMGHGLAVVVACGTSRIARMQSGVITNAQRIRKPNPLRSRNSHMFMWHLE